MTDLELKTIIFHCDTGSCFKVLLKRVQSDGDIFNTSGEFADSNREHAERIIRSALQDGYLYGDDNWLRLTKRAMNI